MENVFLAHSWENGVQYVGGLQVAWFVGGPVCFFANLPLPDLPVTPTPLESFQCSFVAFLECLSHSIQFVNSVHDFFDQVYVRFSCVNKGQAT